MSISPTREILGTHSPHYIPLHEDKENSSLTKVMAALPYVGPFIGIPRSCSIADKIMVLNFEMEIDTRSRVIELVELKNDYHLAGFISGMLTLILTVYAFTYGFFFGEALTRILGSVATAYSIGSLYNIFSNWCALDDLRSGATEVEIR